METVLGNMVACSAENGICLLAFEDCLSESEAGILRKHFGQEIIEGSNDHLELLESELNEYFLGTRKEFTVKLCPPGSDFQKAVWNELLKISYGSTRTYLEQSVALGNRLAIRAVANANGSNRIAILIPCHRVIGSDGSLTGYGGGIERKRWLLDHERKYSGKNSDLTLF
ncbi:MAG TPA: methylated-DNA--[protein]-cysteine S-methyltransferase [Bacteroidales bacterium]|nr:methylated-DNA--[protein]-cysteine S-methyltransferase [Bacteroidales bacterium]